MGYEWLTDTKSKVNKTPVNYIEPKLKSGYDDDGSDRGPSSEGTGSSIRAQDEIHTGEILSDFADKSSTKIQIACEKMKVASESDSEDEEDKNVIDC